MRVVLCGKNDAAVECLEHLVIRGAVVWTIATAGDDGQDGWQRSLKKASERHGIPVDQPKNINDPAFVEKLAAFGATALVSIQYDQILRNSLFFAARCPCMNLHFSLLPRNRGVAPIAWAILNGDPETGVTLHHMTEAIDAGDLIAQRSVPLTTEDTARHVYDRVSEAAVMLFKQSYPFSDETLKRSQPQPASAACYHRQGDFDFSERRIDWHRPALSLHRWIRAMIFPPFQYPELSGCRGRLAVKRIAGTITPANSSPPGTVVGVAEEGIDVASGDGVIRISDLFDPAQADTSALSLVSGFSVGDQLQ